MHTDEKRLFLGNLPPNIAEDDIVKRFSKFGNVKSMEIKHRPDSSTFAFLNFEANTETLNSCFHSITRKKWNGYLVKLELAKESFLSRLQQERQTDEQNLFEIEENRITMKKPKERLKCKMKKEKTSENSYDYSANINLNHSNISSDDEKEKVKYKWKLKKFQGIKCVPCENDTTATSENKEPVALNNSVGLLERLESFSNTWKDSQFISGCNKNYKTECQDNTFKESKTKKNVRIKNNMLNEISLISKNLLADEKRKKALDDRKKVLLMQRKAVKMALTSVDSTQKNKRIIFDDDYSEESIENNNIHEVLLASSNDKMQQGTTQKTKLFGDSSDDDNNDGISFKIKSQFEGSEGKKLLELQSRYGNDKRFALDEKFYESGEDDDSKQVNDKIEMNAIDDERNQQLAILQDVLGHHIPLTEEKIIPKSMRMLRFDPTKIEHTKFEKEITSREGTVPNKEAIFNSVLETKSRTKSRQVAKNAENGINVPVSKEKFYKVENSLKESLQKKEKQSTFSIRELFGKNDEGLEEERSDIYSDFTLKKQKQIGWVANPFKYDSSDDDDRDEEDTEDMKLKDTFSQQNQVHFGENFFFVSNDPRLQEGLDFFNKNHIEEEASYDFTKYRRELKQFIRVKVKNNLHSYNKYKNKIGRKRKILRKQ